MMKLCAANVNSLQGVKEVIERLKGILWDLPLSVTLTESLDNSIVLLLLKLSLHNTTILLYEKSTPNFSE
jgi:hypothetical protein